MAVQDMHQIYLLGNCIEMLKHLALWALLMILSLVISPIYFLVWKLVEAKLLWELLYVKGGIMNTKMEEMFIKVDIQNPGHHLDTILIEDNDSSAVQIMPYHNLEGGTHKMVSCAGMYQRIPVGAQEL